MRRERYGWLALLLLAWALGVLPLAVQPLRALEEPLLDLRLRLRGPVDPGRAVAVVAIDPESQQALGAWPWGEQQLRELLQALASERPRALVCTFALPPALAAEGLPCPLVRPRRLRWRPYDAARPVQPLEPAAPGLGLAVIPETGLVRRLPVLVRAGAEGSWEPTLLGAALAAAGAPLPGAPEQPAAIPLELEGAFAHLRIDFAGGPESYPTVSAVRLVRGELAGQGVLRDRVVVLGPTDPIAARGWATPLGGGAPMAEPELLAAALDGALRGRTLRWQPAGLGAALLGGGLLAAALALRLLRPLAGLVLAALGAALAWGWSQLALAAGTIVPVLPWLLGLGTVAVGTALLRAASLDQELGRLVEQTARLDRRAVGAAGAGDDPQRWGRALEMAALLFESDSQLLFRLDPAAMRLELLAAHRCSEAEVAERRRDARRSPWKEAADPLRQVVQQGFMRPERKVVTLLVPLVAVSRLLGFLAVNRPEGTEDAFVGQRSLLRFVAGQLATLLRREELRRPPRAGRRRLLAALGRDRLQLRLAMLAGVVHGIVDSKNLLVETLDAIDDGVILCDLFGTVLYYNRRVAELSERAGARLEGRTMFDFLHEIAGLERRALVARLAEVVQGQPLELEVRPPGRGGKSYRFALSVVRGEEGAILGLVATFSDITSLKQLDQMKTNLLNMVSYRVLNMLASIQGYAELLSEAEGLTAEERQFVQAIHGQAMGLSGVFDSVQVMAGMDLGGGGLKLMPIDLVELVRQAFEEAVAELGGDRGIALDLQAPERFDIVAADRRLLGRAIGDSVRFALENAEPGSSLRVRIAEEERYLRIDIRNQGYGLPGEVVAALFAPPLEAAGEQGRQAPLAKVKEVLELHGGTVKADGVVGEGVRLHLWLPLFMKGAGAAERG
ncbi:MAG: hypothetical protein KatS3mg102_1974 [Planctomycetota bacterium]|nr:MAG: hypothetical protein KatS3mg102_1974 [Planctomycetota bacterium]